MYLLVIVFIWEINIIQDVTSLDSSPCNLPNECQLIKPYEIQGRYEHVIKCSLSDAGFDIGSSKNNLSAIAEIKNCEITNKKKFFILFLPQNPFSTYILDKLFNFANLKSYMLKFPNKLFYSVRFNYIQGFHVNMMELSSSSSSYLESRVQFYKSKLDFFNRENKRVESCEVWLINRQSRHIFLFFRYSNL